VLAGIVTLPLAIMVIACAPVSGRLVAAGRSRTVLVIAGAATAAGGILFALVTITTPLWLTLTAPGLIGAGFGFVNAPITSTAVAALPPARPPPSPPPVARPAPQSVSRPSAPCSGRPRRRPAPPLTPPAPGRS
jgi:uncharacterized membrane protein YedE/YeeE